MSAPSFDLVDILQTLRNNKKTIIIATVVVALLGGGVFLASKRLYRATGSFMMSNPLYTDRNNLFQGAGVQFVDYFAGDDDVDKMMALVEADTIKYQVSEKVHLAEHYGLDMSKPKDVKKLVDMFKDNFKVVRSEYNGCEVSFDDADPKVAADVVNESMRAIEATYKGYYTSQRQKLMNALTLKLHEIDSNVELLTDSLAALRDKYKIYDLVNPARNNIVTSSIHSNGAANFGWALEQVQNMESLKDQLVSDRAKYVSVINEYSTTLKADGNELMHVMSSARVPAKPKQPGLTLTVLGCAFAAFLFSSIFVLIRTYYRTVIAIKR
jgi:uncharacterized protein involved in exopolysaccharide biosynthesis